ncbi:MAG: sulfatase-like hydrolase/transferase [Planctomycetota bacterium]
MDKIIGRLMKKLQDEGLDKNTFVLFLGDNGTGRGVRSRMGDRVVVGGKGLTKKSGMHVPLIVHWPEGAKPGTVSDDLVDSTDILPTICQVAGIEIPTSMKVDGRSFLPQVKGETGSPREWIYSWYCPRGENLREFVFNRDYKLYRSGEFYDLRRDPEEKHPLKLGSLAGEAKEDHLLLAKALAQFDDARPELLQNLAAEKSKPRKGKRAKQE